MKLYIMSYFKEFGCEDRDWEIACGENQREAIVYIKKYFKDELELSDEDIKDMDIEAYEVPSINGYRVHLVPEINEEK